MNIFFQKTHQRGFGTYPLRGEALRRAVVSAAEIGYRAFDTAQMYGNEADVGTALRATGLPFDDFCITTKVHPDNFDVVRFIPSIERSLRDLGVDRVDVLLLHWPPADGDVAPSLELLQQAVDRELARNVGVSNYTGDMLRTAVSLLDVPLVTNQVEFHPLLDQQQLLRDAEAVDVPLSAYCSVARGEVLKRPELAEIGRTYGKSAIQVALRWSLQKGVSINTMSSNPENIRANFDIMDFTLSHVDMARIERLCRRNYRIVSADVSPWAPAEWR